MDVEDNYIYIDQEWLAITNAFNKYFLNEDNNYSLLDIFEENSKLLYNDIVLNKMKMNRNKNVDVFDNDIDLEDKINCLKIKKFKKREKVKYELNQQTDLILEIFGLSKYNNNKHILSSMYLNKKK